MRPPQTRVAPRRRANACAPADCLVEPPTKVNTSTVTWWYQCKKMSLRFRNTIKAVSTSSGNCRVKAGGFHRCEFHDSRRRAHSGLTFDTTNMNPQNPTTPLPYHWLAVSHTCRRQNPLSASRVAQHTTARPVQSHREMGAAGKQVHQKVRHTARNRDGAKNAEAEVPVCQHPAVPTHSIRACTPRGRLRELPTFAC